MGMGATAGLHGGNLHWHGHISDIEYPDTPKTFITDGIRHALQSTIQTTPRLLDRHDQQVAINGHIALPTGTDDGAQQLRRQRVVQTVEVVSMVVAGHRDVAGKRQIGVGKIQQTGAWLCFLIIQIGSLWLSLTRQRPHPAHGQSLRVFGIKKSIRLGQRGQQIHVH